MSEKTGTAEQVEAWTKITTLVLGHAMVEMGQKLIASVDEVDPLKEKKGRLDQLQDQLEVLEKRLQTVELLQDAADDDDGAGTHD